jgi:hypothetical protein
MLPMSADLQLDYDDDNYDELVPKVSIFPYRSRDNTAHPPPQPEPRDQSADCPVCKESLGIGVLFVCGVCRNGVHRRCWDKWCCSNLRAPRCVMCRELVGAA